jgi:fatty acid desaturase
MSRPIHLSPDDLDAFGREIDAIQNEVKSSLGDADRRYIQRMIRLQRSLALIGRLVIFSSIAFWPGFHHRAAGVASFAIVLCLGTLMLGLSKILENMEIGHNVLHGQWDWMNDPNIHSSTWEWDTVCPSDQWKHSHNVLHHTWTNVIGRDRDVGYEILRVTDAQPWHPAYLLQPLYNTLLALLFEWGIALHDVDLTGLLRGKKSFREVSTNLKGVRQKALKQAAKDYVLWPLLAGPFFPVVLLANVAANLMRNTWSYMIIFCGHFPSGVAVFTEEDVESETRGGFLARQLLASCNIEGGSLFQVLSGNLSFQIEHHLFPDLPSNRYAEVAPRVRAIAARYGLPYNSGSLTRQFGTTTWKIWRLSLPSFALD